MITPADLDQYIGTTAWHRYMPPFLLTDGAKAAAEELGCFWLYDIVWSVLDKLRAKADGFAVVELKKKGRHGAVVTITDGNEKPIYTQKIIYTDFPWDEFSFYVAQEGDDWIILLKSEY